MVKKIINIGQNLDKGIIYYSGAECDARDIIKEIQAQAIEVIRCSTQLKDKKTITFKEWIESNKGYIISGDVFNEHGYQQNRNELVKRYNKIHNL